MTAANPRPFKVYRYAAVGRCLYDTHTSWDAAEAAVKTGKFNYPDQKFEIITDEQNCPGHVASENDPKVCGRCGVHIDSLRPD